MTSIHQKMSLDAASSLKWKRRKTLLTTFALVALAPLLTNCGSSTLKLAGVPPGPPSHDNAWLSYKFNRGCGPFANLSSTCQNLGKAGFDDSNGLSEASKYYCSIGVDPTSCAAGNTPQYAFGKWKADNGFPATGFPPAHAFYSNSADLQLGRDMNCVQNGLNVACYVSNYGPPPFVNGAENPAWPNLDAAVDAAINQTPPGDPSGFGLFATVAMIFNPNGVGPNGDTVTFYVFNGQGSLVNNAALDGEGNKSVPRMCMACHGGTYTENKAPGFPYNSTAPGINFLPFDVWLFHLSPDRAPWNNALNPTLQEGFRQLNHLVKITHTTQSPTPADSAILEMINDQYNQAGLCGGQNQPPCGVDTAPAGGISGAQVPADPPPPTGWASNPNLYSTVFRPYCRMCHLGQGSGGLRDLTFNNVGSLSAPEVNTLACVRHDMPHAEAPLGGQSGSKNLPNGLWWNLQALDDLNAFLSGQTGCH